MDKIEWCLSAKNGLEIIEPNVRLSWAYIKKAEESLRATAALRGIKNWEISSSYYTMYFSLYAILMKIGVKCEIHSCTISFMKMYLKDYFSREDVSLIEESQKARIDCQYYSDRNITNELYNRMKEETPAFLVKCKKIINLLTEEKISDIRSKIIEKKGDSFLDFP